MDPIIIIITIIIITIIIIIIIIIQSHKILYTAIFKAKFLSKLCSF